MNNIVEKFLIMEILEKIYRLQYFINSNKSFSKDYTNKVTIEVFQTAIDKIFSGLNLPIQVLKSEKLNSEERESVLRRLSNILLTIKKIHSKLNYIHSDWVRPETYTFASQLQHYLPSEYTKTKLNIILSDDYDFKENNLNNKFIEIFNESILSINPMNSNYPTVFLPKMEFCNPLNWSIIAHEIGHIYEDEIKMLISHVQHLIDSAENIHKASLITWAEEIYCDLIGTNLLGPSYFISLVSYSITTSGIGSQNLNSKSHPSNLLRIRILYEYLISNDLILNVKSPSGGDIELVKFFFDMIEDIDDVEREMLFKSKIKIDDIPNLTEFVDLLKEKSLELSSGKILYKGDNVSNLAKRLLRGIPIGTFNKTFSEEDIDKLTKEYIAEKYSAVRSNISEEATNIWEILSAGWSHKVSFIFEKAMEKIFQESELSLKEKCKDINNMFEILDDRLLKSIESSELYRLLEV